MVVISDRTMVVENCGYMQLEVKKESPKRKIPTVEEVLAQAKIDARGKASQFVAVSSHEESEYDNAGVPSAAEIARSLGIPAEAHKKYLDNDIPVPVLQMESE